LLDSYKPREYSGVSSKENIREFFCLLVTTDIEGMMEKDWLSIGKDF
jgi:hypothetical protein